MFGIRTQAIFNNVFDKMVATAQPIRGFRRVKGGKNFQSSGCFTMEKLISFIAFSTVHEVVAFNEYLTVICFGWLVWRSISCTCGFVWRFFACSNHALFSTTSVLLCSCSLWHHALTGNYHIRWLWPLSLALLLSPWLSVIICVSLWSGWFTIVCSIHIIMFCWVEGTDM